MNPPVRWGFLSTSEIGANAYLPAIRASRNGTVHAIASRTREKAEAFARKYDIPKAHATYADLLADPDVDVIYNPLPVSMHAEWTIKALEAGKPVLCEKPLCLDAVEARAIAAAADRAGLPCAEAVMYRYHPLTRKVVEIVRSGALGDLRSIQSCFHGVQKPGTDIRFNPVLGGGAMLDLGIYCVNFARLIAGTEPVAIKAAGWIGPTGVDESASVAMAFPGGVAASFACSLRTPFQCEYCITGTNGRLLVRTGALVAWPNTEFSIELSIDGRSENLTTPAANHYRILAEAFADAILGIAPLEYPLSDSVANMEVLDEILRQIRA